MKKTANRKKPGNGYLFWITGLSGSGKTTLANKITPYIKSKYNPVITLSGDDIRKNSILTSSIKPPESNTHFLLKTL